MIAQFETTEEVHFAYNEACLSTLAYPLTLNVRQYTMHAIKAILNIFSDLGQFSCALKKFHGEGKSKTIPRFLLPAYL